ncbi:MAG TPA: hypothetical protein ENN07_07615, partial [candidate division Zixibacteria bacterium]|nr:hypothetical protein [candidate division Zixibacteria bacterium]
MNRVFIAMLALAMLLMVGSAIAEEMDACTDQFIIMIVYNDPLFTDGVLTSPKGVSDDTSGCPDFGPDGVVYHMSYPDTLPFVERVAQIEADFSDEPIITETPLTASEWWHQDVLTGTEITLPPVAQPNCCVDGVFWKARMFDAASGDWSNWTDVN